MFKVKDGAVSVGPERVDRWSSEDSMHLGNGKSSCFNSTIKRERANLKTENLVYEHK